MGQPMYTRKVSSPAASSHPTLCLSVFLFLHIHIQLHSLYTASGAGLAESPRLQFSASWGNRLDTPILNPKNP